jgi:hypothetical protein
MALKRVCMNMCHARPFRQSQIEIVTAAQHHIDWLVWFYIPEILGYIYYIPKYLSVLPTSGEAVLFFVDFVGDPLTKRL